jgi:hypothetical protein
VDIPRLLSRGQVLLALIVCAECKSCKAKALRVKTLENYDHYFYICPCRFVLDFGQNWFDGTNFIEILFSVTKVARCNFLYGEDD